MMTWHPSWMPGAVILASMFGCWERIQRVNISLRRGIENSLDSKLDSKLFIPSIMTHSGRATLDWLARILNLDAEITQGDTMTFTHEIKADVICDSQPPEGARLTTMLVTYNRFIIAEVDTHRKFSRNSASSRAIPFGKQLERAAQHPAPFVEYPCEQPGMSGGALLEGRDLDDGLEVLRQIQDDTISTLEAYLDAHPDKSTRLHKSILNRPLEWFGWTTTVISSTEWDNFFKQRATPQAQPEFRELAYKMQDALAHSTPVQVPWGHWHLPFLDATDIAGMSLTQAKQVSAARCARTSYLTHDERRDIEDDLRLYNDTLAKYGHWSPMEHPAVCLDPRGDTVGRVPEHLGNFDLPWHQMRHVG